MGNGEMNNPWDINSAPIVNRWPQEEKPSWLTEEIKAQLEMHKLPLDQDGMLALHQIAKDRLSFYKELEMDYRKVCVAFLVPEKSEGTHNVELGNGYTAKAKIKYNYKLDNDNDKVWAGLDRIEKIGNDGKFIAERLVSWTPNFLLTEYRQLQEDAEKGSPFAKECLKEVETFLTITDAAPELEIREPKAKKK